jgi:hypothetical protein
LRERKFPGGFDSRPPPPPRPPSGTATSFNTVEGAKVPWWVRFPAASATTTAQRDSKEGRASVATEAGPSWRRTDLMLAPDEIIDG